MESMPEQQVDRPNYELHFPLHRSLPLSVSFFLHMGLKLYMGGKCVTVVFFMLFFSLVDLFASMTGSQYANHFGYSLLEKRTHF